MSVFAAGTSATAAAWITAAGAVVAALIVAVVAIRAQSYKQLLRDFDRVVRQAVADVLTETLGRRRSGAHGRRWYDQTDDD